MREPSTRLTRAAALSTLAFAALLAVVARPDAVVAGPGAWPWTSARADTDSVAVPEALRQALDASLADSTEADTTEVPFGADSLGGDSLASDTTETDSTARARTYFSRPTGSGSGVSVIPQRLPGVRGRLGSYWQRQVVLDTAAYVYRISESVGQADVRAPAQLTLPEFLAARRQQALGEQFRTLATQRSDRQTQGRGGLGFAVDIPGGDQSAFRTLFGKNEVALTVNGTSNVDLGIRYDQSDLQEARSGGNATSFAPDFGQELNLNVAGTIGDKLAINVNYDTQSQFDFENQVSLVYTGYEDDIIQRIEAGNVFLQTPSTLIRGGQRLFGIRTDFQFGPLALTAVASQQDAETVDKVFEGGTDVQRFNLAPYRYEDDTHFFLGYAFHNWWDRAHEQPQTPRLPPDLGRIENIEVWKHEPGLVNSSNEDVPTTWAVALADLGEPSRVPDGGEAYLGVFNPADGTYPGENDQAGGALLPTPDLDQYPTSLLDAIRADGSTVSVESINAQVDRDLPSSGAFANNVFRRLIANVDYVIDDQLGWISLTTQLSDGDLLAVAYQYRRRDGTLVTVGDYGRPAQGAAQTGPRTILKLLRADNPTPAAPLWDLTMRNIYRIGGRSLTEPNFSLGITYKPPGGSANALAPSDEISFEQRTFLQVLGLDRVNGQGLATADDQFDFRSGVTVNPDNGRVIFPVRQPFGDYLYNLVDSGWTVGSVGAQGRQIGVSYVGLTKTEALARYVPSQADVSETNGIATLYDLLQDRASTLLSSLTNYTIEGEYKSSSQSVFTLGFQLVEGTVRVTSGDIELQENIDYRVNYSGGTVEIINSQYLQAGQRVQVSVEQNKFISIGSKSLLGLRGDLRLAEDFTLGGTWMRLAERPAGDGKFQIGEEPLNNTIIGFDGAFRAEPRWLTRALDALPLIQTRAPSRIEVRGEVARLSPGHPETFAFDRTRTALLDAGLDFADDELAGVSFIDAFEQSENTYSSLGFTGGWRIAAPPSEATGTATAGPDVDVTDPDLRSNWRGLFAWYSLNRSNYRAFREQGLETPATEPVPILELFPQRPPPQAGEDSQLDLLDLYFDPTRRGPYNFSGDLAGQFAQRPQDVWGGFVQAIDNSYSNFDGQNNVEFVEMLFAPLGGLDGTQPVDAGAKLYLDLGRLNEDVLPNRFLNSEDGLVSNDPVESDIDNWGRRPTGRSDGLVNLDRDTGVTEDLGLDGLPSLNRLGEATYPLSEAEQFRDFLVTLPVGSPEQLRAAQDPSGDDYYYFTDTRFNDRARYPTTPQGASVQERFANYLPAFEVNSALAQQAVSTEESGGPGVAIRPNSEDVNNNNTLESSESFHRYEIPLDAAGLASSPFFQNTLSTTDEQGRAQTWYLLRIPVRTQNKREFDVEEDDFSRVESVRLWTTGHTRPVTMRFASFELVGSQWLKSETVGFTDEPGDDPDILNGTPPALFIESINNEENPTIYAIPRGTIQNTSRSSSGALRPTREQSLILRAEGLADGRRAGIVRSYATRPLDLTKNSNLRLSVHGDGFRRDDNVKVFVRFGDDEVENYYEIEQPLYPFDPDDLSLLPECPPLQPFNCARSDSLWQTNVGGVQGLDLNPINVVLSELNRTKLERDQAGALLNTRYSITDPEGAPPGARITVRGQPSIQDVRTIVLGVRNASGGETVIDTVSVWFNELRVTGYDEGGGASGFLTTTMALADVAQVNARMSFTQDGFGDLGGALGGRSFASQTAFTLTSSLSAHKFIPERFGWSIPVSFSLAENASTPRYDPDNGDVRLSDLVETTREGVDVDGVPADLRADAILERARTESASRTISIQASKSGSRSPWLRYTLDGITASYASSAQSGSNPSNQLTSADTWDGTLAYRLAGLQPFTVTPFWFSRPVPLVGSVLGGLQLNLLPTNLTLSTDVGRNVSAIQPRVSSRFLGEPDSVQAFRALTRRTQQFDHGRVMELGLRPFPFLQMTYGSTVSQDLGAAGQREAFRILVRDSSGAFSRQYDISPLDARDPASQVYQDLVNALDGFDDGDPFPDDRVSILGGSDLEVLPVTEALGNVFGGDIRTQSYTQRASASARVSLAKVKWLSWIQPQALSYSSNYGWRDQPNASAPDLDIASASTQASIQTGARLQPRTFWRLFPFYRSLEASAGRGPGARSQPAASDSSSGGFNPLNLARDVFLGVTSVEDVTLTYRGSTSAAASGLEGQAFSFLSALTGAAPPLGYRLGLTRDIGIDSRITDDQAFNTFSDLLGSQHDVDARTQISPIRGLSIGLNWRTTFGSSEQIDYQIDDLGEITPSFGRRTGKGTSTVFGFGGSYEGIVARHADRYARDLAEADGGVVTSEFRSPTGLADDFTDELARGFGVFGPNGLYALPLPGWTVTYSGLERLPFVNKIATQISLQHGYSATSETGVATFFDPDSRVYAFNGLTFAGEGATATDGLDEPTQITVNERFQPLVGFNFGFKGGVQASLSTNRSSISTLQTASAQIYQKTSRDLRFDFSYSRTGLRLFGLRGVNNNIRFQLTTTVSDDAISTRQNFLTDVERVINGNDVADASVETSSRLQISPQISYTISNQVTANFISQYERTFSERTGGQATRFTGGVSLRILFSN